MLKEDLEKSNINVYIPKIIGYNEDDFSPKIEELSILKKKKYPITLIIKDYSFKLKHKGKEDSPFVGWGDWPFDGEIWFEGFVKMELRNTKTGELIDTIEFYKRYPNEKIKLIVYTGTTLDFKKGKEELKNITQKSINLFLNDIKNLIKGYNWNEVYSLIK